MRVFFDDNKKIIGVVTDDTASFNYLPANQIYCPYEITNKIERTVEVMRQKADVSGFPLFLKPDGTATREAITLGTNNHPVIETQDLTRQIGFLEAPGEWAIEDVLTSKYFTLAQGQKVWYCEFLDTSVIDFDNSAVNTGFNGVSILPGGYLQFASLKLSQKVSKLRLYIEAGQDRNKSVEVEVSVGGQKFMKIADLAKPSDSFVFRISDPQAQGIATPIYAFAVFY